MKTFVANHKIIVIIVGVMLLLILVAFYYNSRVKYHDPFGDKTYLGNIYYPESGTSTPLPGQNVFPETFQLITPENVVFANTTIAELTSLTEQIDKTIQKIFAKNDSEFKLLVQITINPVEHFSIKIATQGSVDNDKIDLLYGELEKLPPIYSKTDQLMFQLTYTVKENK